MGANDEPLLNPPCDISAMARERAHSRTCIMPMQVRMLSLDPEDTLKVLAVQAIAAAPDSLLLLDTPAPGADDAAAGALFLHVGVCDAHALLARAAFHMVHACTAAGAVCDAHSVPPSRTHAPPGLSNGVLLRTEVDRVTGQLTDTRSRFLGTRAPKLFAVSVRGRRSMLALSSRPWLGYSDMGRYNLTPLSYEALDYASPFASDQCPEGFCAVSRNTLRILTLERLGETFNQQARAPADPLRVRRRLLRACPPRICTPSWALNTVTRSQHTCMHSPPWPTGHATAVHASQVHCAPGPQDAHHR